MQHFLLMKVLRDRHATEMVSQIEEARVLKEQLANIDRGNSKKAEDATALEDEIVKQRTDMVDLEKENSALRWSLEDLK